MTDLATELAASLTARDPQYRTLATRIEDPCAMPIGPGNDCVLPGDHLGACRGMPVRCTCSHPRSSHGRGVAQCYATLCGCGSWAVKA